MRREPWSIRAVPSIKACGIEQAAHRCRSAISPDQAASFARTKSILS